MCTVLQLKFQPPLTATFSVSTAFEQWQASLTIVHLYVMKSSELSTELCIQPYPSQFFFVAKKAARGRTGYKAQLHNQLHSDATVGYPSRTNT